jgi:hypothetical protein
MGQGFFPFSLERVQEDHRLTTPMPSVSFKKKFILLGKSRGQNESGNTEDCFPFVA